MMRKNNTQSAFTVLELVLALSILGLILTVSYGSVGSFVRSKNIMDDDQEVIRAQQVLTRRLNLEFQLSYDIPLLPPRDNLERRFSSYENMIGENDTMPNGKPRDTVTFVALSAGQYFLEGKTTNSGLVQINYRVMEDPENRNPDGSEIFALVREEVPYKRPYEDAYKEAVKFPLLDSVEGFMVEYFDSENGRWLRQWGGEELQNLPSMLRYTIYVKTPNGRDRVITGTAPLRAKRRRR